MKLTITRNREWQEWWMAWLCRIAAPHRWKRRPVVRFDLIEEVGPSVSHETKPRRRGRG
jgi:hypothetical protein